MIHDMPSTRGTERCSRCGARQGYLTTDCPGLWLRDGHFRAVLSGRLDYVDDRWVDKGLTADDDIVLRAQVAVCKEYPHLRYEDALKQNYADLRARFGDADPHFVRGYYAGINATTPGTVPDRIAGGDVLLQAGKVFSIQYMLEEAQGWTPC
jgi:hypothetical protein